MIIAKALGRLFKDLTVKIGSKDYKVSYHYGNQVELIRWTAQGNNKYPLIWYVIEDYMEINNKFNSDIKLIIISNSNVTSLNNTKADTEFLQSIDVVSGMVKSLVLKSPYISVFGKLSNKFSNLDLPDFGANNAFNGVKKDGNALIPISAKAVVFKASICCECIK